MESSGRIFSFLVSAFLVVAALLCLAGATCLLLVGRLETARQFAELLHRPEKLDIFTSVYLTPPRFFLFVLLLSGLAFLLGLLAIFSYRKRAMAAGMGEWLWLETKNLSADIAQEFRSLLGYQKLVLVAFMGALAAVQLCLLMWFPAHTDEAFSFVFFVRKGLLTIISYYPLPNNHVLYNILCWPFYKIGLPPLAVMRLPSLVAAWLVAILFFVMVKKLWGFKAGFLSMALFSSGVYSLYFAVHGRGYMLLTFFALLSGYAVLRFCQCQCRIFLVIFTIASALGFYTVPVFAYPFASLSLFGAGALLFTRKMVAFRQFFLACIVAVILTLLLYSPILLTSGFGAFYGSDVRQIAGQDFRSLFLPYLLAIPENYWGLGAFSLVLPLAVTFLFWRSRNRQEPENMLAPVFLSWMVFSVLFWVMMPQLLPPERTWLYWSLFVCWGLGLLLAPLFGDLKFSEGKTALLLLLSGLGWLAFETYSIRHKVKTGEIQVFWPLPKIIEEVLASPARRVFAGHEFYDLMLQFESVKAGHPIKVDLYLFQPPYDFLFVSRHRAFPAGVDSAEYRLVFQDHLITAYRRKALPDR